MAAHLYLGDESVLSFGAAGRIRGWWDFEDDPVELSTTGARRAVGLGFTVHHCDDYVLEGREIVKGLPVTSVPRTITDLAGVRDFRAQRALDGALRKGTDLGTFWLFHDREWTTGRRGIAILRTWLQERTPGLAATDEDLREDLLVIIRKAGLPEPVQEYSFVLPSGPIRFDLAYPERRLAIEGDGYAVHGDLGAFNDDRQRDVEAGLFGWVVLRFTWAQITFRPDYVARSIAQHLALRPPTCT
ncbi:MAG: endonuclease domain-containing protein [Actinomycetota bacterium]